MSTRYTPVGHWGPTRNPRIDLETIQTKIRYDQREQSDDDKTRSKTMKWWELFYAIAYLLQALGYIVVATTNPGLQTFVPIFNMFVTYDSEYYGTEVAFLTVQHWVNIKILWCGVTVFLLSSIISTIYFILEHYYFRTWISRRLTLLIGRAVVDGLLYVLVGFQVGMLSVSQSILLAGLAFVKVASIAPFTKFRAIVDASSEVDALLIKAWLRDAPCSRSMPFIISLVAGILTWIAIWWTTGFFWWNVGTNIESYILVVVWLCFFFYVVFLGSMCYDWADTGRDMEILLIYEMIFFLAITIISWLGYVEIGFHYQNIVDTQCFASVPF